MNIGIVSLGLIGGSLLKALSETENTLYAVTRNKQTIEEAKKITPNISDDKQILKDCDVVFVASPIDKTLSILESLEGIVSKDCIVLDCASVKSFVMNKTFDYKFIGSHPMAGTEFNGYNASFKDLFKGAKWVLTPPQTINNKDIEFVSKILQEIGAQVIISNAKEHDEAVALISHMPLLLSQALFYAASNNELALKLASSGFRDMTRLATSNLEMAKDMMNYNNKNINKALNNLFESISCLKNQNKADLLSELKNKRLNMYSKDGKNIF